MCCGLSRVGTVYECLFVCLCMFVWVCELCLVYFCVCLFVSLFGCRSFVFVFFSFAWICLYDCVF